MNSLSGVAAIVVIPPVVRTIEFMIADADRGGMGMGSRMAIWVLWGAAAAWAFIAVKIRNWRIDRKGGAECEPVA